MLRTNNRMEKNSRLLLLGAFCLVLLAISGNASSGQTDADASDLGNSGSASGNASSGQTDADASDLGNSGSASDNVTSSNDTSTGDVTPSNETSTGDDISSNDTATVDVTPSNDTFIVDVTPSNDTSTGDVTPTNDTSTDTGIPSTDTAEATPKAPEKADFVVYDNHDQPCLLASLNITIHFKYPVQEGLTRETYDTVSKKNTQDGSRNWGTCEDKRSTLSITWNNDTFTLNLTFILQGGEESNTEELEMDVLPPGANSSAPFWSLRQVSLSYDTANEDIFPGASDPSVQNVGADLNLFKTPEGMSYTCKTPAAVTVNFDNVDLAFNSVHLMPFDVQSQYFSNETVECSGDLSSVETKEESYTVPLIVAGVLAGIVVLILIVYASIRCVSRRMRQADYKQME